MKRSDLWMIGCWVFTALFFGGVGYKVGYGHGWWSWEGRADPFKEYVTGYKHGWGDGRTGRWSPLPEGMAATPVLEMPPGWMFDCLPRETK